MNAVEIATSPRLALSSIDVTRAGSFVVSSIARVSLSPFAVVMSTSCWPPSRRTLATLAPGSSAARTIVIG